MANWAREIGENIGRIVRYILPGVVILSGAWAAHPSWFAEVRLDEPWHLITLAVIAIVAGNTWYAFHRYGFHQIIDFVFYALRREGPVPSKKITGFPDDLPRYVVRSFGKSDALRQHVALRASSMHLMYIASEVSILFNINAESGSLFERHGRFMLIAGIIGLILTLWQNLITRRIDYQSINAGRAV
jgi:hypothetical protein